MTKRVKTSTLLLFLFLLPLVSVAHEEKESGAEPQEEPVVWGPSDQYLKIEAGYTLHAINFTTDASSEYQRVIYGSKDRYELRLGLSYWNKYFEEAFQFGLGGTYFPLGALALDLDASFAPSKRVVPQQGYEAGLRYRLLRDRLELGARYAFSDFRQGDLHEGGPVGRLRIVKDLWLTGRYQIGRTLQAGGGSFDNQAFLFQIDSKIIGGIALSAFYGRSAHDLEGGAPDNPFKSYRAHDYGGRFKLSFLMGSGLFFEFRGEDRDNGQVYNAFTVGTFFEL